jgi:hypothetical protein
MDRRELDEIDRFLAMTGQASLLTYYGVQPTTPTEDVDAFVKKRRAWAQGQQSNPKFKSEALFVIKQNALIRKALLEEPEEYRTHLNAGHVQRNVESLRLFINARLSSGTGLEGAEAAIRSHGRELGLPDVLISQQMEAAMTAAGLRQEPGSAPTPAPSLVDFYEVLDTPAQSSTEQLEQAYRARYRWARGLNDLTRSADMLNKLDQAWTVLRDPERRARYDARRTMWAQANESMQSGVLGLLGGALAPVDEPELSEDASSYTPGFKANHLTPTTSASEPPIRSDRSSPSLHDDDEHTNINFPMPVAPQMPPLGPHPGLSNQAAEARQDLRPRGPRLSVDGPDAITIHTKDARVRHRLLVRNTGDGKMSGRVVADHDWLEITKPQLDDRASTQVVEVVVHIDRMPWRSASAALTVVTDHGERKSVAFHVSRKSMMPWVIAASVLTAIGGVAVAVMLLRGGSARNAKLNLSIDPPADHVYVNGVDIGAGASIAYQSGDVGAPLRLRVEANGFAPHDELMQLDAGKSIDRRIRLDLSDRMNWAPPTGASDQAIPEAVAAIVQAKASTIATCLSVIAPEDAHFKVMIDGTGLARQVDLLAPTGASDDAIGCINRAFRVMRFGALQADYGELDTVVHLMPATAP